MTAPRVQGKNQYIMPINEHERRRLNMQHTVVRSQFGYLLDPTIKISGCDRILDTGCGTGIWAAELSSQLPESVQFECCDLSTALFPPKEMSLLPSGSNVHFSQQNVLSLPQQWTDSFDVVHQRLMVACFPRPTWVAALKELYRVTRPGGFIQLVERDQGTIDPVLLGSIDSAMARILGLMKELFDKNGMVWLLEQELPLMLEEVGFRNVVKRSKIFALEGHGVARRSCGSVEELELEPIATSLPSGAMAQSGVDPDASELECIVEIIRQFKPKVIGAGWGISADEYDRLIESTSMAWKDVPKTEKGIGFTWHWITAQKPTHY